MLYDIIGDIHGQAGKLEDLLATMGYSFDGERGCWAHPTRTVLFVGDFVDRGPEQLRTLGIVKGMVENGEAKAVLGNHEFNAIAWFERDPQNLGQHLRKHTDKNFHQHQRFLEEVGDGSPTHKYWIDWFYTLPLWIDEDVRVIHACWHTPSMDALKDQLGPHNTLTPQLVEKASRKGSAEYDAVELLCKGMEVALPNGVVFVDKQGVARTQTRTAWWNERLTTYKQASLVNKELAEQLPDDPIPLHSLVNYDNVKPLFFGHYWMTGAPRILGDKLCCVDYSAAIGDHPLVGYRFDGEKQLEVHKFVSSTAPTVSEQRKVSP